MSRGRGSNSSKKEVARQLELLAPPRHFERDPQQLSEGLAFFLPQLHNRNGGGFNTNPALAATV